MIERARLLGDLQRLLRGLEADLLERSESADVPEVGATLRAEYEQARAAQRTAQSYAEWRAEFATQVAAAWALSGVFVRFLEDNLLVDPPKISGPGERLARARDEHEIYFRAQPTETDRDYLLHVFETLARLPGAREIFGEHNPVRELPNWLSGDAAGALLQFFQRVVPETGALVHDFTDPEWDTRFLGDLYQDLSEAARKKYALLQTPEFVEEFILDRTLDPAIDEFGLDGSRMIDPACGSGHFLLGSFVRLLDRWQRREPGTNARALVQRALDSIHGVDLNPYAVAVSRFRLLLAAMKACGITRLADAPAFHLNLACGDSLLHAPLKSGQQFFDYALVSEAEECDHAYMTEDLPALKRMLVPGQYHAVVANPPYITPKDRQLNERYRRRFASCHMKYALAVPFMEQLFRLAVRGDTASGSGSASAGKPTSAGYVGQITANSFMKREFGKKLIERFLPRVDLTHVIDTSGAYIPGHGTPTVILFGRNRPPLAGTIRTVLGVRGEPQTPDDPALGKVWLAIRMQVDQANSVSGFVSVRDAARASFQRYPWSIGGGGAAELKEWLEANTPGRLGDFASAIGFASFSGEDDVFIVRRGVLSRAGIEANWQRVLVRGEDVRDWASAPEEECLCLYDPVSHEPCDLGDGKAYRYLWRFRTLLSATKDFGGKTKIESGTPWWSWYRWVKERYQTPLPIIYSYVSTHNHFVRGRSGQVFRGGASVGVIKLPREATDEDHEPLLVLLNSSAACFWMKQVSFPKGGDQVGQAGARVRRTWWDERFEFTGTGLQGCPLPAERSELLAAGLDTLARNHSNSSPPSLHSCAASVPSDNHIRAAHAWWCSTSAQMVTRQEEIDWQCYRLYSLIDEDLTYGQEPPPILLGQRAFEIVMARKMAAGELETTWFERHGSTPITDIPAAWPEEYRRLVERRIAVIESDRNIGLIEQPEYKRRWNTEPWEAQLERALREWLLDRLESIFDFDGRMNDAGTPTATVGVTLLSTVRLADLARGDTDFMHVGELYRGDPAFDVQRLVDELVEAEAVPLLPVLRYKAGGLVKRAEWERTWELQRQEDEVERQLREALARDGEAPGRDTLILFEEAEGLALARAAFFPDDEEASAWRRPPAPHLRFQELVRRAQRRCVGEVAVPPKYESSDFQKSSYWRLRGKLDVPKERWVSFPHCEGPDGAPVIAWAGYDHLQLARAISEYYVEVQERLGGRDDPRLVPLLGCLIEVLPWLKQWHNDVDPEFGMPMGDYFEGFVREEARQAGKTPEEIRAWQPPQRRGRGGRR